MTPSVLAGGVSIRDGAEAIFRDGSGVLPYREYRLVLLFEWGCLKRHNGVSRRHHCRNHGGHQGFRRYMTVIPYPMFPSKLFRSSIAENLALVMILQ